MKSSFFIPFVLPGLNEIIAAAKYGKGAGNRYRKLKSDTEMIIFAAVKKSGLSPFTEPVFIHFEWIEPNRRRDPDNVAAGKKFCLDLLQKTGTISGDGWKHIAGLKDTFRVDKDNPGVLVTISSCP